MRNNLSLFTVCSLIFLALLILSGSIPGVWSEAVYFLAFVIPIGVGLKLAKPKPQSETGEVYQRTAMGYFGFSGKGARLTVPCILPAVALIFLLSYLTSLAMSALTGAENTVDVGNNLPIAIIMHALVPALLEEGLFRLLPMYMLSGYSRRVAVFISALYFALVHNSLFTIPYAFLAGAIFIVLDIMTESVWPSVIIHFINNVLSIMWIFYCGSEAFVLWFTLVLCVLSLLSAGVIFLMRDEYKAAFSGLFSLDEKYIPTYEPLMFIIPTLISATVALF